MPRSLNHSTQIKAINFIETIVFISLVIQVIALLTPIDISQYSHRFIFGSLEMLLILLLAWNGWRIYRWANTLTADTAINSSHALLIKQIAMLCLISLCLCIGGDFINRNYFDLYYSFSSSIKFTHLADSVWFFFPGYAVFIYACYIASKHSMKISNTEILISSFIMIIIGVISYLDMYKKAEDVGIYFTTMTASYAPIISIVAITAFWLVKAYGFKLMKWVALGAITATIADVIIANFWIFREGYYPAVSHINWMVYFTSQALIQLLPLALYSALKKPQANR